MLAVEERPDDLDVRLVRAARSVATGREGDTLQDLMSQMTAGKFRHVPIVEQGNLIGIVSIGDVVKHRLAEIEAETQAMRDYISA